ncbi:hypothetical protein O3G_MSEX003845 [Manduca sexta]|uniref:Uncharacterized protein n=1 Tax=Manduca sexta TaxID=7130 RepID=A0A921YTP5_MANSE|nr:hypothetical protein O3G_MSEX003845 [Manduca sexta]
MIRIQVGLRSLGEEPEKKPAPAPVPAVYIVKYNKFVDTVLEKMNEILSKSYDPVSVKLQPIDASKKSSKPKKNKTKTKKRKTSSKKKNTARGNTTNKNKGNISSTAIPEMAKDENTQLNEIRPNDPVLEQIVESTTSMESRALKSGTESGKAKPTTTKVRPPTKPLKAKPKPKPPTKTTTKKPVTTKNKTKTGEKNKPRAKGTLYGLSTLRRSGDVAVSIMSDHTTIKSNFAVGPLILRVEKEVGRGAKKELKSATATTTEMVGKMSLRVNNEGVATLHSIKVLQPKQVRVDSNHERTRELVWQRSARIAHVVSEKLMSASKPMFHRQPVVKQ